MIYYTVHISFTRTSSHVFFSKWKTPYVLYWPNPPRVAVQQPSPRPAWTHPEIWAPLAKSVANKRIPDLRARQGDRGKRFIQERRRRGKASGLTSRSCCTRTEKGKRRGRGFAQGKGRQITGVTTKKSQHMGSGERSFSLSPVLYNGGSIAFPSSTYDWSRNGSSTCIRVTRNVRELLYVSD